MKFADMISRSRTARTAVCQPNPRIPPTTPRGRDDSDATKTPSGLGLSAVRSACPPAGPGVALGWCEEAWIRLPDVLLESRLHSGISGEERTSPGGDASQPVVLVSAQRMGPREAGLFRFRRSRRPDCRATV